MKILAIFGALILAYSMIRTLLAPKPDVRDGDEATITSKKCPHCGVYVDQTDSKCPSCGGKL